MGVYYDGAGGSAISLNDQKASFVASDGRICTSYRELLAHEGHLKSLAEEARINQICHCVEDPRLFPLLHRKFSSDCVLHDRYPIQARQTFVGEVFWASLENAEDLRLVRNLDFPIFPQPTSVPDITEFPCLCLGFSFFCEDKWKYNRITSTTLLCSFLIPHKMVVELIGQDIADSTALLEEISNEELLGARR